MLESVEDVEGFKLEEIWTNSEATKLSEGRKLDERLADSIEELEKLAVGLLRPGQSVTVGWHEVMVIKVVESTVIIEGAAVSREKVTGSSIAAKTKKRSILVLLSQSWQYVISKMP